MRAFRIGSWVLAAGMLAMAAHPAWGQFMPGYGSVRYSSFRGPLGGRVTVAQGPFGGGAVGVRGPFGGRFSLVRPGLTPVWPTPFVTTPVVPVPIIPQTVLNPAPALMPYSAAYQALIPAAYPTLAIGGTNYYDTTALPPLAQPTILGGVNYFVSNGIYYQPYFLGARTVYLVAPR